MSERLEDVGAVIIMACEVGESVAEDVLGFPCISCVDTLYFGIMKENNEIQKYGYITRYGDEQ